jgi:hypothetical protein
MLVLSLTGFDPEANIGPSFDETRQTPSRRCFRSAIVPRYDAWVTHEAAGPNRTGRRCSHLALYDASATGTNAGRRVSRPINV